MINLNEKAKELVKKLKKFNGVLIYTRYEKPLEHDELVPDEMSTKEYENYIRDKAYFIAQPDLLSITPDSDNQYVDINVNYTAFHKDLLAYIQKEVGDDVTINYRDGCNEYELLRKNGN